MLSTPDQAAPYVFRVRALRMLGHLKEAQTLADAAVERFPDSPEIPMERAWIGIFRSNWTSAQNDAHRAGELNSNLADAVMVEGIIHRETEKWEQAIDCFSRADRLRPNDADILLNRGRAALELGRRNAAIADFDRSLQIDPLSAQAFFHRGRAYAAKGMLAEASRDLTKAINLRTEAAAPYVVRGELLGRAGEWAKAAGDADTAIALGSDDLRAHLTACRAAEAMEAWVGLEPRAWAMVRAFPKDSRSHLFLFHALNGLDRMEEALVACDQAIQLSTENILLPLERANLFITLSRYPAAIDDCSRVLQKQPTQSGYRGSDAEVVTLSEGSGLGVRLLGTGAPDAPLPVMALSTAELTATPSTLQEEILRNGPAQARTAVWELMKETAVKALVPERWKNAELAVEHVDKVQEFAGDLFTALEAQNLVAAAASDRPEESLAIIDSIDSVTRQAPTFGMTNNPFSSRELEVGYKLLHEEKVTTEDLQTIAGDHTESYFMDKISSRLLKGDR